MIQYKGITNTAYNLKERELILKEWGMEEEFPHVALSTCNRLEIYWGEGRVPVPILRHLYRVAAGLESSLVGERAIQGQLKTAYAEATGKYRLSPALNRLFQTAIHTGKRVRTETRIAEGAISHSQVTADILRQEQIDLKKKIITIIGVNKLTEDLLRFLSARGAANIFLSNRNFTKATDMAARYKGTAMRLEQKKNLLKFTDVLICATSAPHALIGPEDMPAEKEMLVFDLAFPRDVKEEVGKMERIRVFNLEDVERFARENRVLRYHEIGKAEEIIEAEMSRFYEWQSYREKKKKYEKSKIG